MTPNSTPTPTSIRYSNHPFRFLLYLEWALLGTAAYLELLIRFYPSPWIGVSCVLGFALLGLRLPLGSMRLRLLYTLLELSLLGVVVWLSNVRLLAFMYVPLMVRSCLILPLTGRLAVGGIIFVLFLVSLERRFNHVDLFLVAVDPSYWRYVLFTVSIVMILSLVFVTLLIHTLMVERQGREKLAQANEQLRHYALHIEKLATLQERNRIAREIHDSLGHSLTALNIQLEGGLKLWAKDPAQALSFLSEAKQLGTTALQDVRESVAALRSDPLKGISLAKGIRRLAQDFQRSSGIQPICQIEIAPDQTFQPDIEGSIYRIIQEALTNSCKHAQATQVKICLQATATEVQLQLEDNGKGFNQHQNTTGFGLQGMRERTQALGGTFELRTQVGAGCWIKVTIPLA